jgi:hypothetical protein
MKSRINNQKISPYFIQGVSMMRVFSAASLSMLFCIALAATPAAAIVIVNPIDTFGDAQYQAASGPNGDNNILDAGRTVIVNSGLVASSGRSVFVEKTAGSVDVGKKVEAVVSNIDGSFSVSRASGIGGRVLVQWDGGTLDADAPAAFDPLSNLTHQLNGGSGIDLTAGSAVGLSIRVLDADLAGQQLTLTLFGVDNKVASEQSVVLPSVVPPGSFDALFPFVGFTQLGSALSSPNPNQIYAITLAITGPAGADVTLDLLGTYTHAPEPGSASLLGLGGVALLARARRRLKNQK